MKIPALVGLLLLAVGAIALAYEGMRALRHDELLEFRPRDAAEQRVPVSPVLGVIALASGVVLTLAGTRRT